MHLLFCSFERRRTNSAWKRSWLLQDLELLPISISSLSCIRGSVLRLGSTAIWPSWGCWNWCGSFTISSVLVAKWGVKLVLFLCVHQHAYACDCVAERLPSLSNIASTSVHSAFYIFSVHISRSQFMKLTVLSSHLVLQGKQTVMEQLVLHSSLDMVDEKVWYFTSFPYHFLPVSWSEI